MTDQDERRSAFDARLAELKQRMEAGLTARAHTLREAVSRLLSGDESARKVLKTESHKLRGIAGSYGYEELTELAAELEKRASISPPPQVEELANRLADAAELVGKRSTAAQNAANAQAVQRQPSQVVETVQEATPASRASSTRTRAERSRPLTVGAHGGAVRVLAMDDDPTTLRLLNLTLKEVGGFDAVLVTAAKHALEQMQLREFDVILSDAMMPDMNGLEFCNAARRLGGYAREVPIIILSAATKDELEWHGGLNGPVVWLRKPFMPTALVQDVARVVEAHRLRSPA
jgi:CheY-like chemotaxis protein/HPt (histidine-containing phosphotransfer) domain-containing protein